MFIDESRIGRRVIVQITKDHDPEVWKIHDIRHSFFGRFIAFRTIDDMEITTKLASLYSIKFVAEDNSQYQ
jgi:hypothetical protein